jgi:hypothetical protein
MAAMYWLQNRQSKYWKNTNKVDQHFDIDVFQVENKLEQNLTVKELESVINSIPNESHHK